MDGFVAQQRTSLRHFSLAQAASVLERSHLRLCAVLVLLSLACFLPGFTSLQPMDRDEPRYAQASKQMLETGDFVDIRFQDEARHKKPVGIYWMQSATVAVGEALGRAGGAHDHRALSPPLPARRPCDGAADLLGGARFPRPARGFPRGGPHGDLDHPHGRGAARQDRCHARRLLRRGHGRPGAGLSQPGRRAFCPSGRLLIFWLGFAVGILVKGPLVPMFVGLCAAVLFYRERSARWLLTLRPWLGGLATLLIVLPWFVAIAIKSGGAFFSASVGHDMLGKVGTAQTYTGRRRASTCVAFFATFWPGADPGGHRRAVRLDPPPGGAGRLRAGLDRAVLARLRGGADQAAALRHAALPGGRDPHRDGDLTPFRRPASARRQARHDPDSVHPARPDHRPLGA